MAVSKTDYAARSALEFFLKSIDYPEGAPAGATSFVLQVDGGEIAALSTGAAVRLVCRLTDDAANLPRLAEYAAGRVSLAGDVRDIRCPCVAKIFRDVLRFVRLVARTAGTDCG